MIASTSAFEIGVGFAGAAPAAAVDDAPEAGAAAAVVVDCGAEDALGVAAAAFDPKIAFTMLPKMLTMPPPFVFDRSVLVFAPEAKAAP
jgi:hypothetical protein